MHKKVKSTQREQRNIKAKPTARTRMMMMKVLAFIALMTVTNTYGKPFGKVPLYSFLYFFSLSYVTF